MSGTFCAAWGCLNRQKKGMTFHRFPRDEERRKQWAVALKREGCQATDYTRICGDHFEKECYNPSGLLKHNAVPTIFKFPAHLQKKMKPRKNSAPRNLPTESLMSMSSSPSSSSKPEMRAPETSDVIHRDQVEHSYCVSSPGKMKRKLEEVQKRSHSYRKKLKLEQRKNSRLSAKTVTLTDMVKDLKKRSLISDSCADMLESSFSEVPPQLIQRLLKNRVPTQTFHPALKAFAMTLQFYSTKAYDFVRETFGLGLPDTSTIRQWYRSVDGSVGFNRQVLMSLEKKAEESRERGCELLCALMLHEMSIKKHVEWDGKRMVGFVDIGNGVTDDSVPPATEALVFMLVAVNWSWKVPIGYFFIHGISGKEKANLIRECLHQVADVGVKVISLTCDGPSSHVAMLKDLGATMDPENLDSSFPHPSSGHRIYVLLDVCHMLKLLWNSLAACGLLKDGNDNIIRWRYLEELNTIQESEGLHLANNLQKAHLCWEAQNMKVRLAAQTFSKSVANALEYCRDGLRLPAFHDVQGTVHFIRTVDQLFDVLNSRNQYAKGMRGGLKPDLPDGSCSKMAFLNEAFDYIKSLHDSAGNKMYTTTRKTAFIGFMAAIRATQALYKQYVGDGKSLKYLLTYKLSQDHLELFFSAIRAHGGCNNNPTVRQFVACFKRMIMRHGIRITTGNVTAQDETTVLQSADSISKMQEAIEDDTCTMDIMMARRYQPTQADEDISLEDIPALPELSIYRESAVGYIAGFVVRMVCRSVNCPDCRSALSVKAMDGSQPSHGLILQKDLGGLTKPSPSVVDICIQSEKLIQKMLFINKQRLPQGEGLTGALVHAVLERTGDWVFHSLADHMLDTEPENNHVFALIKTVTRGYVKIRMHHLAKEYNTLIMGNYNILERK